MSGDNNLLKIPDNMPDKRAIYLSNKLPCGQIECAGRYVGHFKSFQART